MLVIRTHFTAVQIRDFPSTDPRVLLVPTAEPVVGKERKVIERFWKQHDAVAYLVVE